MFAALFGVMLLGLARAPIAVLLLGLLGQIEFKDPTSFFTQFGALGGVGLLIVALLNILKTVGVIKDGETPKYLIGLNVVGVVALYFLGIFRPETDITGLDKTAADIATVLITLFGLVWQLISTRLSHEKALRGIPVIGKSYSLENQQAAVLASATTMQDEMARRQEG